MDSDGVFAHFDQNVLQRFGALPRDIKNDDEMWRLINADPMFWPEMPMMPGATELWDAIKHVEPTVLTGCPKSDYQRAAELKLSWWANSHFAHKQ
ncbi:MAG: hypothetical protein EOO77_29410, partial [Oxalobacteraceae bacterium]